MSLSTEQQRMVLDGAVKLASSQELSTISLDDLNKVSGISAFDIVRHYHSKEKILAAVLERELELIAGSVPAPELRFPGETLKFDARALAFPGKPEANQYLTRSYRSGWKPKG